MERVSPKALLHQLSKYEIQLSARRRQCRLNEDNTPSIIVPTDSSGHPVTLEDREIAERMMREIALCKIRSPNLPQGSESVLL